MKNIFLIIGFGVILASASCSKGPQGYNPNSYSGAMQAGWDSTSLGQITQDCQIYLAGSNANQINNVCACYTNMVAQRYSPDDISSNTDSTIDSDLSSIIQYCSSQAGL